MERIMGVSGPGTFDNDDAMWYLDELIQQLVKTIEHTFEPPFNLEDGEALIMANVDILITLCQTYQESPFV